jgi:deoxycytidylate deaminase
MFVMNEIKYMSKKQQMICDLAQELAKKSDMEKSKHGAVIVNGKKIIGMGYNRYCQNKKCYTIHAEVDAILNAIKKYGKESLYNSELYVIRISKEDHITRQSRHDCSRHDCSRHDYSRHDYSRHDYSRHDYSRHDYSRHDYSRHDCSRHDCSRHNLRMSKPCENCTNFIIKNNINIVYYSID